MEIPPWFDPSQTPGKVCRLKKPLNGLKQSLQSWFDRFKKVMVAWLISISMSITPSIT